MPRYDQVQFIGLVSDTRLSVINRKYHGLSPEQCYTEQLRVLDNAITRLMKNPQLAAVSNILKIVTLPEGFFRPAQTEAYPTEMISQISDAVRAIISDPRFRNYLFILGTIVAFYESTQHRKSIQNVCVVMKGGENVGTVGNTLFIYKAAVSHQDFQHLAGKISLHGGSGYSPIARYNLGLDVDEFNKNSSRKLFFSLFGLNFGLEICLDHFNGRLHYAYKALALQNRGAAIPPISIHLIISCGMTLQTERIVVKPGGLVFLNDGEYFGTKLCLRELADHYERPDFLSIDLRSDLGYCPSLDYEKESPERWNKDIAIVHAYPPQPIEQDYEEVVVLPQPVLQEVEWMPDEAAEFCPQCGASFGLLKRRHHCRNCGTVVCGNCSNHTLPAKKIQSCTQKISGVTKILSPDENVRVCNDCYATSNTRQNL